MDVPATPAGTQAIAAGRQRILVVEDEPATREALALLFRNAGYHVECAATLDQARAILDRQGVDLVLLDLNLPDRDGLDLARELATHLETGCIIVSSRTDGVDRVVGLEIGADDYITKPFLAREVLARTRAVLRRLASPAPAHQPPTPQPPTPMSWRFAGCMLDPERRLFTDRHGRKVPLTRAEFDLLADLAQADGRVRSRDHLLTAIGGVGSSNFDRSIDVLVARLRKKIEEVPKSPQLIITVPGAGYRLNVAVEREREP